MFEASTFMWLFIFNLITILLPVVFFTLILRAAVNFFKRQYRSVRR